MLDKMKNKTSSHENLFWRLEAIPQTFVYKMRKLFIWINTYINKILLLTEIHLQSGNI